MGHLPFGADATEKEAQRGHYQIRSGSIAGADRVHNRRILLPKQYLRPTYHRLRSQGLGPTEMRIGLNLIRITADAEREWQQRLQRPQRDVEARALERAVKAGDAAVKSSKHISKKRAARRGRQ